MIAVGGIVIAAASLMTKRFRQPDIAVEARAAVVVFGLCLLLCQFLSNQGAGSAGLISGGLFIVVVLLIGVFVALRGRANRRPGKFLPIGLVDPVFPTPQARRARRPVTDV